MKYYLCLPYLKDDQEGILIVCLGALAYILFCWFAAVGPTKEWKPKPTNQNVVPNPGIIGTSTVSNSMFEVSRSPSPDENSTLDDTSSKLQKMLEEMNVRDQQHVIIPNHIQVPESGSTSLSFGSFDANFETNYSASYGKDDDSDKSSTPMCGGSQVPEEIIEETSSRLLSCSITWKYLFCL